MKSGNNFAQARTDERETCANLWRDLIIGLIYWFAKTIFDSSPYAMVWHDSNNQLMLTYVSGHKGAAVLLPGFAISW